MADWSNLGYINAEGGPLLLVDGDLARHWSGVSGADYGRACALFDADPALQGSEIIVDDGQAIVWEMNGPGTAGVFRENESHLVVLRPWLNDPTSPNAPRRIAEEPIKSMTDIGQLTVGSGILVILWATEDGGTLDLAARLASGRPVGNLSIEGAGLILRVEKKVFRCLHDEVETAAGIGRRLHLIAQ
jgi:hypothetical protein